MKIKYLWIIDVSEELEILSKRHEIRKHQSRELVENVIYCKLDAMKHNLAALVYSQSPNELTSVLDGKTILEEYLLDLDDDDPVIAASRWLFDQIVFDSNLWNALSMSTINRHDFEWKGTDLYVELQG